MIRKIEKVNSQNMFDDAARHLLTQRKKSRAPRCRTMCAYRDADGLSCPIGARIPDNEYDTAFERKAVSYISKRPGCKGDAQVKRLRAAARVPEQLVGLAGHIQMIHDSWEVHEWPAKLRWLAKSFKLSTACLDTAVMRKKALLCLNTKP